jgi:hypothetical protein
MWQQLSHRVVILLNPTLQIFNQPTTAGKVDWMHALNISAKFSLRLEHRIVGCNYVWRQRHTRILAQDARTKIVENFAESDGRKDPAAAAGSACQKPAAARVTARASKAALAHRVEVGPGGIYSARCAT